jgi:signal recognition particle subunit SRP54
MAMRGGAPSRSVRNRVPIKYLATGEGIDALEAFDPGQAFFAHPGHSDMLGLIEKAQLAYDEKPRKNRPNAR